MHFHRQQAPQKIDSTVRRVHNQGLIVEWDAEARLQEWDRTLRYSIGSAATVDHAICYDNDQIADLHRTRAILIKIAI